MPASVVSRVAQKRCVMICLLSYARVCMMSVKVARSSLTLRYVEIFKSSTQDLTQYFQNRAAGGRGPAIMPGTFPPRAPAPAAPLAA